MTYRIREYNNKSGGRVFAVERRAFWIFWSTVAISWDTLRLAENYLYALLEDHARKPRAPLVHLTCTA